ncbi:MAG: 6-hydroxymethylpterin diphosphokinase MptE-like protein, partial [Planctomycetota bacterium]
AQKQPALARRIAECEAPCPLVFERTDEAGALTATLEGRALASKRRPLTEAERLAEKPDPHAHGAFVVLGMGLGHHAAALARRMEGLSSVLVFEPDLALLRAVLERVDHTAWLAKKTTVIVTDPDDVGAMTADMKGFEPLFSIGVEFVEHAPNSARLGDRAARLSKTLAAAVASMRMHVITAMVQSDVTVRNQLMNIGHYASRPGIAELEGLCAGRPAILVAAGPSMKHAIARLQDPRVRERCVVIAVQTALRPLLDAGIKPHFVTAIDHHEISKRFYEGLTAEEVEGVTLIAEARANAAILDAFPGDLRLPTDTFLDELLGSDEPRGKLTAAATVAHLNHYLARWLGCDPVVLVGQDLAFTDGQYYGAGAAIHNVWACELNEFNTLETMEWQRIVRSKGHLHRVRDLLDRPVFTDDQMATYLAQFERDFADDARAGLSVIDASDGVRKRHTEPRPLGDVLDGVFAGGTPPVPAIPRAEQNDDGATRRALADRVRRVRTQTRAIGRKADECVSVLEELKEHQGDAGRNRALVREVHRLREEASSQLPAFGLLMRLNQLGGFKRFKADRAIELASHDDQLDEQSARIDRDIANLAWIEEYADVLEDLLSVTERALQGGAKRTRDLTPIDTSASESRERKTVRVGVLIHADTGSRDPERLSRTLERLRSVAGVDRTVVLTREPERYAHVAHADIERAEPIDERTLRSLRAGRVFALDAWRGGLAGLTVWDEAIEPASMAHACERHGFDAALVLGPDWTAIDPVLASSVVERHREAPASHPLVFSQAPPGVSPAVLCTQAFRELAEGRRMARGSMFATVGGIVGYVPNAARHDPIVKPCCVQIDERLRDAGVRAIDDVDSALLSDALLEGADTIAFASALREGVLKRGARTELVIDIARDDPARAERAISEFASSTPMGVVTLLGAHAGLIGRVRETGLLLHVRTDLREWCDELRVPDIVSVDCYADDRDMYTLLTGVDAFDAVRANMKRLIEGVTLVGGMPTTWVVPRLTKRDAVYTHVEAFYDGWLNSTGACVIDPLPAPIEGDRIAPLPPPRRASERAARRRLVLGGEG